MKKVILVWLVIGIIIGAVALGTTNYVLHATSTNDFCSSCHTNDVVPEWKQSVHYSNEFGVRAGCADCHLPEAFVPKMTRKMMALKEVYGHFVGTIDTPEKFEAHRAAMAQNEWARLKSTGAQECKSCHYMDAAKPVAKTEEQVERTKTLLSMHSTLVQMDGGFCSNACHSGLATTPDFTVSSHAGIIGSKQFGACTDCHKGDQMAAAVPEAHVMAAEKNMICTDCHKGVAHKAPTME
jgi:cytochrome c-type protein NapC